MAEAKKNSILNQVTLMAGSQEERRVLLWKAMAVTVTGFLLCMLFMWSQVNGSGQDLPKTIILRHRNAEWNTRIDQMSQKLDRYQELLSMMEERDDRIYRSVYGLDGIPQALRNSGFGGEKRYAALEGTAVLDITRRLDWLEKRAYIQSKSFEDVSLLQRTAGDMATHIPAISPINTDPSTYHMSSPFGYRLHPILGYSKAHTGMDFACNPGNPVYATGDGTVVKAVQDHSGYGIHVEIDHGFGYKTRYAHLSRMYVQEGQKVSRGDCVGLTGRSGMASGPHLHYEVLYRKDYVNPALYMDLTIPAKDYAGMVKKPRK